MPKQYEAIRDNLKTKGKPDAKAKEIAAKTFNARFRKPGQAPVTNKPDSKKPDRPEYPGDPKEK